MRYALVNALKLDTYDASASKIRGNGSMAAVTPGVHDEATVGPLDDAADPVPAGASQLQWYVFGLFFVFGGITSLNDVLIPKLKHLYSLGYFEAMLIQFAFFAVCTRPTGLPDFDPLQSFCPSFY